MKKYIIIEDDCNQLDGGFFINVSSDLEESIVIAYEAGTCVFEFQDQNQINDFLKSVGLFNPEMGSGGNNTFGFSRETNEIELGRGKDETIAEFIFGKLICYVDKYDLRVFDANSIPKEEIDCLVDIVSRKSGDSAVNEKLKLELHRDFNEPLFKNGKVWSKFFDVYLK